MKCIENENNTSLFFLNEINNFFFAKQTNF